MIKRYVSLCDDRGWAEYEDGFGELDGNFWLGLRDLHRLTASAAMELHVYLEDFEQVWQYAAYSHFYVAGSSELYRLSVSGYSGNAGDGLAYHNGRYFTTVDSDNDLYGGNCAVTYGGAWWYGACHSSNLNGLYLSGSHASFANGINWNHFRGNHYSLKTSVLKVRPLWWEI